MCKKLDLTQEETQDIVDLRIQGATQQELADMFLISRTSVRRILAKHNLAKYTHSR